MGQVISKSGNLLFKLEELTSPQLSTPVQFSEYTIIYVPQGSGIFHADFGTFPFQGPTILFATPMQLIYINATAPFHCQLLQFHSDFYCIAYHHAEIACNGLLFNNIYLEPSLKLQVSDHESCLQIFAQITQEINAVVPNEIVLKSLLQLFLAKSSQIKTRDLVQMQTSITRDEAMETFKDLLEQHYVTLRKPSDYANLLGMAPNTFSKRCSKYFKKTASQLITERLILEAKKELHLTRKSIKEIAFTLQFTDEFYFSRVFKKFTNESPQSFRDKTGISIVADLYK